MIKSQTGVNYLSKPRVYEIAKDINISSKTIIDKLQHFDIDVKNHMSTLNDSDIDLLLEIYTQKGEEKSRNDLTQKEDKKAGTVKEANGKEQQNDSGYKNVEERGKSNIKGRYVNTRPSVVDLDRLDIDRIEELVPDKVKDHGKQKQRIRRGAGKSRKEKHAEENLEKIQQKSQKPKAAPVKVTIPDEITVGDLAQKIKVPAAEVIKKLISLGVMAAVNQTIDFDTASLIAEDFGAIVEKEVVITEEDLLFNDVEDDPSQLEPRSPVVVVMGHVDHGKTSLLDAIRHTNVTEMEAGGITQHIGAYRVRVNDKEITFLDTPGHEAFTTMRARGAQVTDIAILVVAADDGVMPQTVEAINHAKAANVSIIVAINKIDKEGANEQRVKQQLTEYGLVAEEWGGDTICVPVSALKKQGIDNLLEMVLLVAEMLELKANPNRPAKGTVIEARLDKGRGPVATVLVQNGTLHVGDVIIAGTAVGKVRAMMDDKGNRVEKAGPSMPAEIIGLSEVPEAGDTFYVVEDEKKARAIAEKRKEKIKEEQFKFQHKASLDDLFAQIKEGKVKELNVIVKADVQGSVEAVRKSLEELSNDEVKIKTIHGGVGAITESDVMLASASNAIIVGFNVRPDSGARASAEMEKVEIRLYRIIYDAIEDMKAAMKGMLEPKFKEVVLGHAEVRATFKVSGVGTIAGCYVTDGKINRNSKVRIVRDGIVIHEGKLESLKRFKDDVREVLAGYECGIGIEKFNDIKEGDVIECFIMEEVKQ
ncbi:MAG: translation initiation factor IF-2 [Clostridiaceae bacterium]|nr:translation initiation factor IF-2 [Clostridiaceae bacterium]